MKKLYLFNPENDMALACASPYYMPPASALRMAAELSVLPAWYAAPGDCVWTHSLEHARRLAEQAPLVPHVQWVVPPLPACDRVQPWGWNPALIHRLHLLGVGDEGCPSPRQMERLRLLSGRQTAAAVLQRVRTLCPQETVGQACVLHTQAQVEAFAAAHAEVLLKAPWSGSGRGIQRVEQALTPQQRGWTGHILATQGAVTGEPFYRKEEDFAMEFRADASGVTFAGYSVFQTDARGRYKENLLAADEVLEARLTRHVSVQTLHRVRDALSAVLSETLGADYCGFLGVDMMICRLPQGQEGGAACAVHPCVEINLRMNMGLVARFFCDRYVCARRSGRYVVEYYPRPAQALAEHARLSRLHPLQLQGGKVNRGYLSLTPVTGHTLWQVYVVID